MTTGRANVAYLVAGADGRLHPVKESKVASVWAGSGTVLGWPVDPAADLTLVSVVRRDLDVACVFLMRLPVRNRRLSQEGVARVLRDAGVAERKPRGEKAKALVAAYSEGLPGDWRTQLAVYLDCAASVVGDLQLGGPLALARQTRMTIDEVLKYLLEKN